MPRKAKAADAGAPAGTAEVQTPTDRIKAMANDLAPGFNFQGMTFNEKDKQIVSQPAVAAGFNFGAPPPTPGAPPLSFGAPPAQNFTPPPNGAPPTPDLNQVLQRLQGIAERLDLQQKGSEAFTATVGQAFNNVFSGLENLAKMAGDVLKAVAALKTSSAPKGAAAPPPPAAAPVPQTFPPVLEQYRDMIFSNATPGRPANEFITQLVEQMAGAGHTVDGQTVANWLLHHGKINPQTGVLQ